ncbi:beta-ketoacyl synthase N-terminal-like domain-containing protein [Streptomyces sp. NPDC057596]|uniref:beta-ketoacyl synthase N-terminal-like domain-containing protein n=1 Tax=Streptomyces sp. NPDC057596 TaxID=3346178 RepID=UPI0036864BC3
MDVATVPAVSSPRLDGDAFRDGDTLTRLRAVDPRGVEETYRRRWGVWHRDLDTRTSRTVTDDEVREWAAAADQEGYVVRHHERPEREPSAAGPRRVVVTGLGAATPLGVGVGELWQGLLDGGTGYGSWRASSSRSCPCGWPGSCRWTPPRCCPGPRRGG